MPYLNYNAKTGAASSAKQALRRSLMRQREAHDAAVLARRSRLAQAQLLESGVWRAARSVGLYMAIQGEAQTNDLLKAALGTGKEVFLPKITDSSTSEMRFAPCASLDGLAPGRWGILEPKAISSQPDELDLLILPGLAFSASGARLGHGGGYYDRFLGARPGFAAAKIGFCLAFQIIEAVPFDALDVPVDAVCSENGLQWI